MFKTDKKTYKPTTSFWLNTVLGGIGFVIFSLVVGLGLWGATGSILLMTIYVFLAKWFANSKYGEKSYLRKWYFRKDSTFDL